MVMPDAKTPPVAFYPVSAYSFSYGQDSGVGRKCLLGQSQDRTRFRLLEAGQEFGV